MDDLQGMPAGLEDVLKDLSALAHQDSRNHYTSVVKMMKAAAAINQKLEKTKVFGTGADISKHAEAPRAAADLMHEILQSNFLKRAPAGHEQLFQSFTALKENAQAKVQEFGEALCNNALKNLKSLEAELAKFDSEREVLSQWKGVRNDVTLLVE